MKKLIRIFLIISSCILLSGAMWEKPEVRQKLQQKAIKIWDDNQSDPIVGEVLGFIPLDAPDTIADWPEYAVKRFVRLDEAMQRRIRGRQRQAEINKLQEAPYGTIMRPIEKTWEIENAWMGKADRDAMMWEKPALQFDRKAGSRYLFLTIPEFSYYTKMFVYGKDAEIVQDFKGHGAITVFDETIPLRVDVFDARGLIGTAIKGPIARWVRIIRDTDVDLAGYLLKGAAAIQDLHDNYLVRFTSLSGVTAYRHLAYLLASGEMVWQEKYVSKVFTMRGNATIIDDNYDVVTLWPTTTTGGKTDKYKIADGTEIWSRSDTTYDVVNLGQLPDGGYVRNEEKSYVWQFRRIDESGVTVSWGNGDATVGGYIEALDSYDPGAVEAWSGISGDGTYVCYASGATGITSYSRDSDGNFTLIDVHDPGVATELWYSGAYFCVVNCCGAAPGPRLWSYSLDGSGYLTQEDAIANPYTHLRAVHGDTSFVYTAALGNPNGGLTSWTMDGVGQFTQKDTDITGTSIRDVWSDRDNSGFVFAIDATNGLMSFTVAAGTGVFTYKARVDPGGTLWKVCSGTNYTFLVTSNGVYSYSVDGAGAFTQEDFKAATVAISAWYDSNFVYVGTATELHLYTVDSAGDLTLYAKISLDTGDIWGDGTFIYAHSNGVDGIYSYRIGKPPGPIVVDDDGYFWHGTENQLEKREGNSGSTQGDLLNTYTHIYDEADDICVSREDNIAFVCEESSTTPHVVCIDTSGTTVFDTEFSTDYALWSISPTDDGGYIIAGTDEGASPDRLFLLKLSRTSETDFLKFFSAPVGYKAMGNDAVQTNDGGFLAIGEYALTNDSVSHAYMIKTNQYGETCSSGVPCE